MFKIQLKNSLSNFLESYGLDIFCSKRRIKTSKNNGGVCIRSISAALIALSASSQGDASNSNWPDNNEFGGINGLGYEIDFEAEWNAALTSFANEIPNFEPAQNEILSDEGLKRKSEWLVPSFVVPRTQQEYIPLAPVFMDVTTLTPVELPSSLNAQLRDYQHQGVTWMQDLRKKGKSGILADDMGLGKTLQTITHLLIEKESGRLIQPALIVCPVSTLENWSREIKRFAPILTTHIHHGADRATSNQVKADILISTYHTVQKDSVVFARNEYSVVVLDEAQNVKNKTSKIFQGIKSLKSSQKIALSGTPVENDLSEMWSLFNILDPELLGDERNFNYKYRFPIEKGYTYKNEAETLKAMISPYVVRRIKAEVLKEMPKKHENFVYVDMTEYQQSVYEPIRAGAYDKLIAEKEPQTTDQEATPSKEKQRGNTILPEIMKLRQLCCAIGLVTEKKEDNVRTAKYVALHQLMDQLLTQGRKILLFSCFAEFLNILEEDLTGKKIKYSKLTGATKAENRTKAIDDFQNSINPVFLISLKAGGVGLNLTTADTVIHYDPWWNPATQSQATDRAYRFGQKSDVSVYHFITKGTIEERMIELQEKKTELANQVIGGYESKKNNKRGSKDEMLELLKK